MIISNQYIALVLHEDELLYSWNGKKPGTAFWRHQDIGELPRYWLVPVMQSVIDL